MAAGHSVAIAAPVDNQSGSGGALAFLRPIGVLTGNERASKLFGMKAGQPGIGTDPSDADVHYVNGSPVAACLYGLDVLAPQKWGGNPDLVISGPNEGNNIGVLNVSSGTYNNIAYAIARGIPAIAFSDARATPLVSWDPALPATHHSYQVASVAMRMIDALVANKQVAGGKLLPTGMGLNVNIPEVSSGSPADLPFRITKIGFSSNYMPAFYEKLSDSAIAASAGANVALPGISITPGGSKLPTGVVLPKDESPVAQSNVVAQKNAITVTPVEVMPEARRVYEEALRLKLEGVAQ